MIDLFLPIGAYGPYPERLRDQFEGVIWRFRTGTQWREMPGEFGPWPTVCGRFRFWRNAGVLTALLEGLTAEAVRQGRADLPLVSVDSTTVRAQPRRRGGARRPGRHGGAGGGRRRRGLRLRQALLGRSRGGLTSKIHLAADRKRRPLSFVLTAGQAADSPQFVPVLNKIRVRLPSGRPRTRPGAVAADKACSSRANRVCLRKRRIKAVVPEKKDQSANRKKKDSRGSRPVTYDASFCRDRNTVGRLIARLENWRGIATRFDKTPEGCLAGLELRASVIRLEDLLRAAN